MVKFRVIVIAAYFFMATTFSHAGDITTLHFEKEPLSEANCANNIEISCPVELAMIKRGIKFLQNDDLDAARLVFEHVAIEGKSKHGAYFLAKTFDHSFLCQFDKKKVRYADNALTTKWYKVAASLGHKGALERLKAKVKGGC